MARIYLALKTGPARFNKLVVLKILRDDLDANRAEFATMFLDEARLAACLHHKNIVQTHEFGEIGGRSYMAMEYLEGKTLREAQRRLAPIPTPEELFVLSETARGLHYAHDFVGLDGKPLSVVHRDVSPQNVFISYDGEVKLLDFGIAKVDGAEHLTQVGTIKGKIDYIAPEQVRGDALDRRADIFSLGAMLWEALTGRRFGGGLNVPQITKFHNRLKGLEPNVREVNPAVPEPLAELVDQALALDPHERTATAAMFADQIDAYLATLPTRPGEESLAALMKAAFEEDRDRRRKSVENQCRDILQQDTGSLQSGQIDLGLVGVSGLDLSGPGTGSSRQLPPVTITPVARSKRWLLAVAALSLALVAGLAVGFRAEPSTSSAQGESDGSGNPLLQHEEPSPVALPLERAGAVSPADSRDPTGVGSTRLVVRAFPESAQVLLDGVALPESPFSGTFPRSDVLHRLEVQARGYQTERRFVKFDHDQDIEIQLRRVPLAPRPAPRRRPVSEREEPVVAPTAAATSQPPVVRPAQPAPGSRLVPGAELKTGRHKPEFDMQDPYAK